jgi:hypothetical protein
MGSNQLTPNQEQKILDDLIQKSPAVKKQCQPYEDALSGWSNSTKKMKKSVYNNFQKYTHLNLCDHLKSDLEKIKKRGLQDGGKKRKSRRKRRKSKRSRTRRRRGGTLPSAMPNVTINTQRALTRKHRMQANAKKRQAYLKAVKERDAMSLKAKRKAFAKGSMGQATRNVLKKKGGKRKSRRRRTRRRRRR